GVPTDIDVTSDPTLVTVVTGGVTASGVVRNSSGSPLAGVEGQWFSDSGESVALAAGADGRDAGSMAGGADAMGGRWYPTGNCCFTVATLVGSLTVDHDRTLNVTMPPVVTVRVSVVDTSAQPVPGMDVQLDSYGGQEVDGTLSDGTPVLFGASGYDNE